MAARPIGSAIISFGMVSIPVKFFSTVDSTKHVSFNMLRSDGSKLKQQYISVSDGEVVEREDRVKGFEFTKGQYVLFTEEEIKAMDAKSTNEIEIAEFIPSEAVHAVYVDKVNYLGPDKGAARSYHLLKEAMRKTGKSALARYSARGKQYLVLIHPLDNGLMMIQLRYQEEVRDFAEVEIPEAEIKEEELKLAIQLVEQVSTDEFHPENYRDEVRDHVLEVIDRKVNGQEIVVTPDEAPETKIIDIMEALKASLQAQAAPQDAKEARKAPRTTVAKKKARAKKAATR